MAFKVLHDEVGDAESDSEVQPIDQHADWIGVHGVEPGEAWSTMDAAIAERESRPTATGVDPPTLAKKQTARSEPILFDSSEAAGSDL